MLKIKKPGKKFSELDIQYQNHFIKEYIATGAAFTLSVIFVILIQKYWYILGCFGIALSYSVYVYSLIYRSLTGKITYLDLVCTDLSRKENSIFGIKDLGAKTCTIMLKSEDGDNFTQSVAFSSSYKTGNIVRIYALEGSISQINQNTYTVINPVFMHILSS